MPPFVKKPQRVWLLWHKAKSVATRPSEIIGLKASTYEAYCLDEAVIYFGTQLDNMLQEAGHKPSKEDRRAKSAREAVLRKIFSESTDQSAGFADPALMFK